MARKRTEDDRPAPTEGPVAPPRRATLKDVGRLAQVDASIVSRVLAGEDWRVSPATRERITEAVRHLNYVPHRGAQALRTGATMTLAMLVPKIGDPAYFSMMAGAKAAAASSNYVMVYVETNDDDDLELEEVKRLSGRVDGVVSATARPGSPSLQLLRSAGTPVILLNRRAEGVFPSVTGQDENGAALAVRHLATLGHRRIAHLSGPLSLDPSQRRRAGYLQAMKQSRLVIDERWMTEAALGEDAAVREVRSLLDLPKRVRPTAIFASTLPSAIGVLSELRACDIAVPTELSVVGFDDDRLADHLWVPLTTVRMPHTAMGHLAVERLISAARGKEVPMETIVAEPPVLVERASTAAPRSRSGR